MNSYLFPVTIFKTSSPLNPVIEVSLENGKLVLNSENANYSYGSLFAIFEKAWEFFKVSFTSKNNILILGLGGGSVAKHLAGSYPHLQVDAVELDPAIITIARDYFDLDAHKNLNPICANAYDFVINSRQKYDLVCIDLFIDTEPPQFCFDEKFIGRVSALCTTQGELIFNQSMNNSAPPVVKNYRQFFENVTVKHIFNNSILYCSGKK